MSWSLSGSYFETCSCDLMCPCNMSFDRGRRVHLGRLMTGSPA